MMTSSVNIIKPCFQQVWFHNSPWSLGNLPGRLDTLYLDTHNNNEYCSMVTAMDRSLGTLLSAIERLGFFLKVW